MEEFKLNFYFNLYKDKCLPNRDTFRKNFKKEHGNFKYLEELIRMIEDYQINKYGTTLYEWENSKTKRNINIYLDAEEKRNKRRCK